MIGLARRSPSSSEHLEALRRSATILPQGTTLDVVAHYDNTANNPRNPNKPPKVVKWGEATTDEICIGFIMLAKKDQDLTQPGEKDDLFKIIKESGGWPILSDHPNQ
jgi:hypothetical protein